MGSRIALQHLPPAPATASSPSSKTRPLRWKQKSVEECYKAALVLHLANGGKLAGNSGVATVVYDFLLEKTVGGTALEHPLKGHALASIVRVLYSVQNMRLCIEQAAGAKPAFRELVRVFHLMDAAADSVTLEPLIAALSEGGLEMSQLREPEDFFKLFLDLLQHLNIAGLHSAFLSTEENMRSACCGYSRISEWEYKYHPERGRGLPPLEPFLESLASHDTAPRIQVTHAGECSVCGQAQEQVTCTSKYRPSARVLHVNCPHRVNFETFESFTLGIGDFPPVLQLSEHCSVDGCRRRFQLGAFVFLGLMAEVGTYGTVTRGSDGWWMHYAPETLEDGVVRGHLVPFEKILSFKQQAMSLFYEELT